MPNKFSKENILNFLKNVSVMSIAVNLNGKPISSVVTFAVDQDFSFYFVTKRETFKSRALQKDPRISLSVWEHNKMLIQAYGTVREITDRKEGENIVKTVLQSVSHIHKKANTFPIKSRLNG